MPALGDLLRERREEHRWTLEDVAQRTRISESYIKALEEGNYDRLPADVHVRGFLRNYALVLGLSPDEVISLYQRERGGEPSLVSIAPVSEPPRTRSYMLPRLGFALFATIFMAACAYLLYFGWLNPPQSQPTPTLPFPTPTNLLPTTTPTMQLILETPLPGTTAPSTPVTYEGYEAVLQVSAACWMRVTADGVQVFEGTLSAGTERTFRAANQLSIRMGNAGGVRVILNGEDLGIQGRPGQVLTRTWPEP